MSSDPWLNYHHLLYFHVAAREGGVTAAARKLRLAQPTLSGQIRQLEEALGEPLFERRGRGVELTETGRMVDRYAEEIFGLGQELVRAIRTRSPGRRLTVGVADTLPKLVVSQLLRPVLVDGTRLDVRDGDMVALLAALGTHDLDLVLSDAPLPSGSGIRAYNHALGDSSVSFCAAAGLADRLVRPFPGCLDGAPLLAPAQGSALRRALDEWLDRHGLRPDVVAEVQDSALLKSFGQDGVGVFAVPTAVLDTVVAQYGVRVLGETEEVRERFWALSGERRVRHPGVAAVLNAARSVFG